MPRFAVLNSNNCVVNFIVADTKEVAEEATSSSCVQMSLDVPWSYLGDAYDGEKFVPERF